MKYATSTYLRDIEDYSLKIYFDYKLDYCILVKKINQIREPFILNEDGIKIKLIDKNYYIFEYIPFNLDYICRVHIDENKKVIEKFFLATKNNKIEKGIPSYDDLKLSLVCVNGNMKIYNLELIDEKLIKNEMTKEDHKKALETIYNIRKEIKENINFVNNIDYTNYI